MGILSFISLAVGASLVGLVAVAMLVAGWELLRQRELQDQLRRDRAAFAATSPLPLMSSPAQLAGAAFARLTSARPATGTEAEGGTPAPRTPPTPRDPHWVETKPMVLNAASAVGDEMAVRKGEVDLVLD